MISQELVHVHVGQAGVQIGKEFLDLYCKEHGIGGDGRVIERQEDKEEEDDKSIIFDETRYSACTPRSVFVDLEPTVIDQLKTGKFRRMIRCDKLISGKEDSANNYARGHYTIGKEYVGQAVKEIRSLMEKCKCCQGIIITHSMAGGTGSGLTSLLVENLRGHFGKIPMMSITVFPSPRFSPIIVEPYNGMHLTRTMQEYLDLSVLVSNESLYEYVSKYWEIEKPNYSNINRLISKVASSMTCTTRFPSTSSQTFSISDTIANLVPYPRIKFVFPNRQSLFFSGQQEKLSSDVLLSKESTLLNSTKNSSLTSLGTYFSSLSIYQGEFSPIDVYQSVHEISDRLKFSEFWCPTGFKSVLNSSSLIDGGTEEEKQSVTLLSNSTAIQYPYEDMCEKFDRMYAKRAFVHWFVGEGLESGEFSESREDTAALVHEYKKLSGSSEEERKRILEQMLDWEKMKDRNLKHLQDRVIRRQML